jgi:hypothetical protein
MPETNKMQSVNGRERPVLRDITPYSMVEVHRCFEEKYCSHLQGRLVTGVKTPNLARIMVTDVLIFEWKLRHLNQKINTIFEPRSTVHGKTRMVNNFMEIDLYVHITDGGFTQR